MNAKALATSHMTWVWSATSHVTSAALNKALHGPRAARLSFPWKIHLRPIIKGGEKNRMRSLLCFTLRLPPRDFGVI